MSSLQNRDATPASVPFEENIWSKKVETVSSREIKFNNDKDWCLEN